MSNNKINLKIKDIVISITCFIFLIVILYFILMDGIGKKGSSGVSGFIEQDNLRKSLGDWYQLVFYTFHANLFFTIIGSSWMFLSKNGIIQNLFFCSICYLLFCFFAVAVFDFASFKTNQYESTKTLFVHIIIPIVSFIILLLIRQDIFLQWKWLWICSFYLTVYIVMTVAIYYTFDFAQDSQYPGKPLWIYGFLDYDNQIMFIPLPGLPLTIIGIVITILLTPFIGIALFLFMKMLFFVKIQRTHKEVLDKILWWGLDSTCTHIHHVQ